MASDVEIGRPVALERGTRGRHAHSARRGVHALMSRERGTCWPDWDRREDQELWDYYARHIIEPGWAGEPSESQVRYIQGVLSKKTKSPFFKRGTHLRRRWGFPADEARITERAIHEVAMWGDPDDPDHNAELIRTAEQRRSEGAVQLPLWPPPDAPSVAADLSDT